QPGNDARSGHRPAAYRAYRGPGAAGLRGRTPCHAADGRRAARRRPDPARPAGPAAAGGDERAEPAAAGLMRARIAAIACLLLAIAGGARAQDAKDAEKRLQSVRGELREVAAQRRKLEGQRGDASRKLREADEQVGG